MNECLFKTISSSVDNQLAPDLSSEVGLCDTVWYEESRGRIYYIKYAGFALNMRYYYYIKHAVLH